MGSFTPVASLSGGVVIGLAAAVLLLTNGQIAGVSGIVLGAIAPRAADRGWRIAFVLGLVAGGVAVSLVAPSLFGGGPVRSAPVLAAAGLLVGAGARLAGGCTSGHGVCGIGRIARRSIAATIVFMATGAGTAIAAGRVLGGSP